MIKSKVSLLVQLEKRPIVIWGARMTGMGFLRFSLANSLNVVRFIDSDLALQNKLVNDVLVSSPDVLATMKKEYENLAIVIAVSLKESEIISMLMDMGFSAHDYILYSDYCESFYTIDIMGSCNLKCPSCAHSIDGDKTPIGRMSLNNLKTVVDKIIDENEIVTHVSLYSWGEPFLHKNLPEIISYLHVNGIAVALSSNLSIDSDELLGNVIRQSPEYLKVSLSGYYPDTYEKTHTGGNIDLVKSNMYRLRYYLDKFKSKTFVDVNYHLYNDNNGLNLEKMRMLCEELKFSLSTTYSLVMPLERCLDYLDGIHDPQTEKLNSMLLVNIEEGLEASSMYRSKICPFKENQININWDLKVPVCCTVFNRDGITVSDNYLESTLEQINSNKNSAKICGKCIKYGLPAYNMGLNQQKWKEIASTKISLDHQ